MNETFEDFLNNKCPSERQTNNDPEGFERWLEEQDVSDIMGYAEEYGVEQFNRGKELTK